MSEPFAAPAEGPTPPRPVGASLPDDCFVFSCAEVVAHAEASFEGAPALHAAMGGRVSARTRAVARLLPAYAYDRPAPRALAGGDPAAVAEIGRHLAALDARFRAFPETVLCASTDIRLSGDVLHYREGPALRVLYETCRACERGVVEAPGLDADRADERFGDDGPYLFLGSAGSFNYGHWLTDDLPRLAAFAVLRRLHPGRTVTLLLPAYNVLIDEVRLRSIRLYLGGDVGWRAVFLDRGRVYAFARLHHVTPCSQEPVAKSPEGIAQVRRRLLDETRGARVKAVLRRAWAAPRAFAAGAGRRLFVDRAEVRGRTIVNRAEVLAALEARGFEAVDPERLDPRQQIVRFSRARVVVGIMGAAMTNTLFCPPGARVVHLAPDPGWTDPFFWDLAAVCGHRYAAVYGRWAASDTPSPWRRFSVAVPDLLGALERV